MNKIRCIVGLGNYGLEYNGTRHNIGFDFIDKIANHFKVTLTANHKFHGIVGAMLYCKHNVILLKPSTYVNLSGNSVLSIANFYKILPDEILVIHDDLDFLPGTIKLKYAGGSGGHNGLKSIISAIGSNYWRLRIGIGSTLNSNIVNFVLNKPSITDRELINNAINKGFSVLDYILDGNYNYAMNKLN